MKILVVDDNPDNRYLLEVLLKSRGYEVAPAENGEDGLEKLQGEHFDLIVSDILMPKMDGYKFCRECKANPDFRAIPFIFVTAAYTGEKDEAFALSLGADRFIRRPTEPDALMAAIEEVMSRGSPKRMLRKGEARYLTEYSERVVQQLERKVAELEREIEEHRRMKQALAESEEKFRCITASAQDAIILMDDSGNIAYWNDAAERIFGYGEKEVKGMQVHRLLSPSRYLQAYEKGFPVFQATGQGEVIGTTREIFAIRKDGKEFPVELSVSGLKLGEKWHAVGIARDVTERKLAEESLSRVNRALRVLSAGNIALVHAQDEKELLGSVCRVIVDAGGYRMAWVGYAIEDKSVRPVAQYGFEEGYLEAHPITWGEEASGKGPTGLAIKTGAVQSSRNILSDPRMILWREDAIRRGYASSIALPLKEEGRAFGTLTIYSERADAFAEDEVRLLNELADDLAYGIHSLRTEAGREESRQRLQKNMEATIQAIASTVEMRDPYTAGHQKRVAELAAAIGREMGVSEDSIHGMYLAGIVHDLGKINIPAEILARPGRLSDIEHELIKIHPRAGYEILKGIEFPWPVAQIVFQHHERLDGSGYPEGLAGEAILKEAKILAVADVVEAMSSHRPYRAGLGIKSAIDEIVKGRGTLFEPAVVDACVRLFEEKKFTFG